ncbi:50S ribosomal protein L30 [Candidatus Bathyarchaeota archaeon]|nr:50S ribosomal protein L30 [Candidatus Bathyarchaeota archaeon]
MSQKGNCLAVIRIRGSVGVRCDVEETLKMLRLTKVNHAVLVANAPTYLGMLRKVKDYVTWGEVSLDAVKLLLRERGELRGGQKLTDALVRCELGYSSIDELAEAIYGLEVMLHDIPNLKPVFRLHPPRGGFKRTKRRPIGSNGESGYRGEAINKLLARMI